MLKEYTEVRKKYNEAYQAKDLDLQKEIGRQQSDIHENRFLPALNEIEKVFCDTKSQNLLGAYIDLLEVSGGSASEAPRWTFAKMYICHPSIVLNTVKTSSNKTQVLEDLGFGFENITSSLDMSSSDIKKLREKINSIK